MAEKKGFFKRLVEGLTKTRDSIVTGMDSIFKNFSMCFHYLSPTFSGFAMHPAIALAAATSGDAR